MKKILLTLTLVISGISFGQTNQDSVDMILNNYFENTGGRDAWASVKGIKMTGNFNYSGMDIPFEVYRMADGRSATVVTFQGMEMKQEVFDGTTLWSTSWMTQKPEKASAEATENAKRSSKGGIDPFLNLKENGYEVTLVGTETVDGVECYKLKVNKGKMLVDSVEVDNISYSFFDMVDFVPLQEETEIKSGQMKGEVAISAFSDYDEVGGIYLPFSLTMKSKGGMGQTMEFDEIIVNPEVDDSMFAFPEE